MTLRSTTITSEGRRTRSRIQVFIAVLIALGLVGWAIAEFGRQQIVTGPDGSMFVTDRNGAAALAELLERRGITVIPYTTRFRDLDPGGALLILDPGLRIEFEDTEIEALETFVEEGGRLVVSGLPNPDLLGTLLPDDLDFGYDAPAEADIRLPLSGVGGTIETDAIRSVRTAEPFVPLAGEPPVAAAFAREAGVVVYVSDGSIFWNQRLERNAAWILSVLGDGPVRFDEVRHGFEATPVAESPTGLLASLPEDVRTVLFLLAPVLVIALIVYGRRFGPPEARHRDLAPPRRELVDAMAGLLARVDQPLDAVAPVSDRVRRLAASRAGRPPDVATADLVAVAPELGLDPAELATALDPTDEQAMLTAQRVLAQLSQKELQ